MLAATLIEEDQRHVRGLRQGGKGFPRAGAESPKGRAAPPVPNPVKDNIAKGNPHDTE
jgi:hypothetical protein